MRTFALTALAALLAASSSALAFPLVGHVADARRSLPPGEDLLVSAPGDLTLAGVLTTTAAVQPGSDGPSIVVRVAGTLTLAPDAILRAADGQDAAAERGLGVVQSKAGGRGGSIILEAARIVAHGAVLQAGSGGRGGDTHALGAPDASAIGGDGGAAGIIRILAPLTGELRRLPGMGGAGGSAQAEGRTGCDAQSGHDWSSRGSDAVVGSGGNANATATDAHCVPPDGTGGRGGNASAIGGNGGIASDGNGGHGGNATAIGGRGGDGQDACFTSTQAALDSGIHGAGNGGIGGHAGAHGGNGGPGRRGGDGGNAYARETGGNGGNATMPLRLGDGGANSDGKGIGIKGGDGGPGDDGGNGGSGTSIERSGDGGSNCGPLVHQGLDIPQSGTTLTLAVLILAAVAARRRA